MFNVAGFSSIKSKKKKIGLISTWVSIMTDCNDQKEKSMSNMEKEEKKRKLMAMIPTATNKEAYHNFPSV